MNLIDPNVLKAGEEKLIDLIVVKLNWKSVRQAVKSQFSIEALKEITIDKGEIIIKDNKIAYQLKLGPQTGLSLVMDRSGELIEIFTSESLKAIKEKLSKPVEEIVEEQTALEDASVMSSEISAMILKINEADQNK